MKIPNLLKPERQSFIYHIDTDNLEVVPMQQVVIGTDTFGVSTGGAELLAYTNGCLTMAVIDFRGRIQRSLLHVSMDPLPIPHLFSREPDMRFDVIERITEYFLQQAFDLCLPAKPRMVMIGGTGGERNDIDAPITYPFLEDEEYLDHEEKKGDPNYYLRITPRIRALIERHGGELLTYFNNMPKRISLHGHQLSVTQSPNEDRPFFTTTWDHRY